MNRPVMPDVFAERTRPAAWLSPAPVAPVLSRRSPKTRLRVDGPVDTLELFEVPS